MLERTRISRSTYVVGDLAVIGKPLCIQKTLEVHVKVENGGWQEWSGARDGQTSAVSVRRLHACPRYTYVCVFIYIYLIYLLGTYVHRIHPTPTTRV